MKPLVELEKKYGLKDYCEHDLRILGERISPAKPEVDEPYLFHPLPEDTSISAGYEPPTSKGGLWR